MAETDKCAQCGHTRGVHTGKNTGYDGDDTECRHQYEEKTPSMSKAKDQCLCRRFK